MLLGAGALLDAHEASTARSTRPVDAEVFLLELNELLEASAGLPGAGRAGAVRILRLADVAGEELDLLVVLDANDGVLPRDVRPVSLVSEALEERAKIARDVRRACRARSGRARDGGSGVGENRARDDGGGRGRRAVLTCARRARGVARGRDRAHRCGCRLA